MLRFIIFLITSILIFSVGNAEPLKLANGEEEACWFKWDDKTKVLRMASFEVGSSYSFSEKEFENLYSQMKRYLKKVGFIRFDEAPYELYLKCSEKGPELRLTVVDSNIRFCAYIKPLKLAGKDILKLMKITPIPDDSFGICGGVIPGKLILDFSKNGATEEEINPCLRKLKNAYQEGFSVIPDKQNERLFHLQLNPKLVFKENRMRESILSEEICGDLISEENLLFDEISVEQEKWIEIRQDQFLGF